MGYPMTYLRVIGRSSLWGGEFADQPDTVHWTMYSGFQPPRPEQPLYTQTLKGDLRRLEHDQRDERHLAEYAKRAGITPEQARAVLDAFFEGGF